MAMEEACVHNSSKIISMNSSSKLITGKVIFPILSEWHFWKLKKNGRKEAITVEVVQLLSSFIKTCVILPIWEIPEPFWEVRIVQNVTKLQRIINLPILMNNKGSSKLEVKSIKLLLLQNLQIIKAQFTMIKLLVHWEFFQEDYQQQELLAISKPRKVMGRTLLRIKLLFVNHKLQVLKYKNMTSSSSPVMDFGIVSRTNKLHKL